MCKKTASVRSRSLDQPLVPGVYLYKISLNELNQRFDDKILLGKGKFSSTLRRVLDTFKTIIYKTVISYQCGNLSTSWKSKYQYRIIEGHFLVMLKVIPL